MKIKNRDRLLGHGEMESRRMEYEGQFKIGLDCAASHFYDEKRGTYFFRGKPTSRGEIIQYLEDLVKSYLIFLIEDPLQQDDFEGFSKITGRIPTLILGDDLFVTNLERLKKGISLKAANAMIFKPNMVGTLTEALETAAFAKEHGYWIVPSGRAGGSVDDPIPDISLAIGAPLGKFGAPQSGERTTYQNHLLRIEEELAERAEFPAREILNLIK